MRCSRRSGDTTGICRETGRRPVAVCENAAQVLGEVRRGGVAVLLPLRQRLEAGPLQLGRDLGDELPRGLRLVVAHLPQQLGKLVARNGTRPVSIS